MDSLNYATAPDSAVETENQSDNSSSGSSLFKTQYVPVPPKQKQRNTTRKFVHIPKSTQATESSSDSSIEPRPLTLKAIFERFKNKKWKRKKKKYKPTGRSAGRPKGRRTTKFSQITEKQFKDKRPGFPFLESENGRKALPWKKILTFEKSLVSENGRKPLPWRKILTFEQAVARGFFNYLEKLKYEYYLKESLKQMNVAEDLEKEDLDSRRYRYLDDDGSLSPIEESAAEEEIAANLEHDECDIKLVAFIFGIQCLDFPKVLAYPNDLCQVLGCDNLELDIPSPDPKQDPIVNCLKKLDLKDYRHHSCGLSRTFCKGCLEDDNFGGTMVTGSGKNQDV